MSVRFSLWLLILGSIALTSWVAVTVRYQGAKLLLFSVTAAVAIGLSIVLLVHLQSRRSPYRPHLLSTNDPYYEPWQQWRAIQRSWDRARLICFLMIAATPLWGFDEGEGAWGFITRLSIQLGIPLILVCILWIPIKREKRFHCPRCGGVFVWYGANHRNGGEFCAHCKLPQYARHETEAADLSYGQ